MEILGTLIVPPWFGGVAALVENLDLQPKLIAEQPGESSAPGDRVSSGN
ncbi:MAG TPA: hypothetical protein V6D21_22445 [Candidatus Obscuribacterales bacterium]